MRLGLLEAGGNGAAAGACSKDALARIAVFGVGDDGDVHVELVS